jgi:lanosterol synthase
VHDHDVVIIGAGPVGCVAALSFARKGRDVLLLEANARACERLAGEWLHPAAVEVLRDLDVPLSDDEIHARGRGFVVFPDDGSEPVVLPYADGSVGLCCEHATLVGLLRQRVTQVPRITYLEPVRVSDVSGQGITYRRDGGSPRTVSAGLIVGATGRSTGSLSRPGTGVNASPLARISGIVLTDAGLPFEGFGHVILGGPGPILAYRLSRNRIRMCLDVPPGVEVHRDPHLALWEAFSRALPEGLRSAFREALQKGPVLWASNPIRPRADYGRAGFPLVGDAVGHHHPLTALGLTAGFLDAQMLAHTRTFQSYRRRRTSENRVPEMLAVSLHEIFAGASEDAAQMRQALFEIWRRDPGERLRSMRFLAAQDTSPVRFGRSFLKVAVSAWRSSLREGLEAGRLERTWSISKSLAGRVRWLVETSLRSIRSGGSSGTAPASLEVAPTPSPIEGGPLSPAEPARVSADPLAALIRGARFLSDLQKTEGSWEGEVVWCPMLAAQYVLMCHITGTPIDSTRRRRLLRHFETTRLPSGLWGLHELSAPYLFVTTLVYVAARVLGTPKEGPLLEPALAFIRREGVLSIPSWGKFWLAMMNLYSWDGVNPILPEIWRLPEVLPLHPSRYYCHTRLIYLGMASIYGRRFQTPVTPVIEALREELYPDGFASVSPSRARRSLRAAEIVTPPGMALRAVNGFLKTAERFHRASYRAETLNLLREHIRYEFRTTDHTCISPVSGLLNMIALWLSDPQDADLRAALARFDGWIWEDDEQGTRVAGARSTCWDTAFAVQALGAAAVHTDVREAIDRGHRYLESQQIRRPFDRAPEFHRTDPTGGTCFAEIWHGWPVSDCTAEALLARLEGGSGRADPVDLGEAVRFILRCQNTDGGFGSYEARRVDIPMEWLNPAEMFGDCMTEGSYVECTASCAMALSAFHRRHPGILADQIRTAVLRAGRHLRKLQRADGSWSANWGVHFIYGTFFGVRGLLASGVPPADAGIRRACAWIRGLQRPDGGWGEHHSGCLTGSYTGHRESQVTQTAWALLTLLEAEDPDGESLERAARFLAAAQTPTGDWPRQDPVGVFFRTALLDYTLYRRYFPVWALANYETRRRERLLNQVASESTALPGEKVGIPS